MSSRRTTLGAALATAAAIASTGHNVHAFQPQMGGHPRGVRLTGPSVWGQEAGRFGLLPTRTHHLGLTDQEGPLHRSGSLPPVLRMVVESTDDGVYSAPFVTTPLQRAGAQAVVKDWVLANPVAGEDYSWLRAGWLRWAARTEGGGTEDRLEEAQQQVQQLFSHDVLSRMIALGQGPTSTAPMRLQIFADGVPELHFQDAFWAIVDAIEVQLGRVPALMRAEKAASNWLISREKASLLAALELLNQRQKFKVYRELAQSMWVFILSTQIGKPRRAFITLLWRMCFKCNKPGMTHVEQNACIHVATKHHTQLELIRFDMDLKAHLVENVGKKYLPTLFEQWIERIEHREDPKLKPFFDLVEEIGAKVLTPKPGEGAEAEGEHLQHHLQHPMDMDNFFNMLG